MTNQIIAVGNLKGGTGKSTIAVNLACRLAEKQRSVVLIDADPQGTAAAWLRAEPPPGLRVVPLPLARMADHDMWIDGVSDTRSRHEKIVIDLPPQTAECFEAALRVTDLLVVPMTLSEVDAHATAQALAVLHRTRAVRDGSPSCLLVPSKVDRRTSLGRQARAAMGGMGWEVGPAVGQRAAHVEAFGAGKWIGAHAPDSPAHLEMLALVEQVEDQLARCKEAEVCRPEHVNAGVVAAAEIDGTRGAPLRLGALCLHLMATLLAKLRRAEQQALF